MKNYNTNMFSARLLMSMVVAFMTYGAWAVVKPVAVWNRDFPLTGNSATRGDITLDLNGNTSDGAAITITSSANGGVRLMNSSHPYGEVTALVAIKTNDVNFASQPVFGTGRRWVSNTDTRNNDCGTYITSTGYQHGFHSNSTDWKDAANVAWPSGIGLNYAAFHYQTQKNYGSRGTYAYYTTPTGYSTSYDNKSNLVNGDAATLYGVTIGGCYNKTDTTLSIGQMAGAEIQFIALFASTYADQSTYASPSELQKWSLTDMTAAETITSSGGNITSGNRSSYGVNLNGGTVYVTADTTIAALFVQEDTELVFADGATLTITGPIYVADNKTLTITSVATISGSQVFITAGSVCATAGAIVSSDASYSAAVTSTTVGLTAYSNEASVSGAVDWSSITWADGTWHDGSPTTLTLTDDATINFDATYAMPSLTLTGAHAAMLVYTKTPTISNGVSCENSATCKIKIPATSTDWPLSSAWTVPNDGVTYILAGSADSGSLTSCSGQITVNGKLETTGYLNLSGSNKIASTGELKVLNGKTKMTSGSNANGICGTLTIENGAEFENVTNDGLHYDGTPTVNVYGTLNMASTRWTLGGAALSFYAGSTITGVGQNNYGALDPNNVKMFNILACAGHDTVDFSAKLRPRTQPTFNIASGVTVNCTGTVGDYQAQINITGNGKFKIATGASFPASVPFNVTSPATLELAGGTVADAIKGTGNLSVASGTYEPSFSSFSGAVSVSGSGTVLTLTPAQVTAVSGITVGSGSTLKIKVTADEILHGYDASGKVSNGGGTVMFVDSSGTEITENVSGDGETLGAAAKIWGDSASGTWDTAANWTVGVAPSDGDTVLLETADATITISTSSAAGAVSVNESTTIAGTAEALQSFATKVTSITIASGKTLTLSCTDAGVYEFNRSIGGAGALAVSRGTVTFKQENTFTGGLTVKQGGTLVKGDGVKRFGPDGRSITVEVGGTLDLNKTSVSGTGVSYAITIVEGDSSVWETKPVLTNTGDSLGTGWKQTSSITVRANATIECNSNHDWGLLASGYGTSSLKIGKGKTLRKVGGGEFWLTNVTLSNLDGDSGSGDAVLKIVAGSANVINQGPSYSNSLSSGALFKVEVVGGSLEVNKDFTISALSHQGGSVNIAADKTLTVSSINVAANATMSPSGTIACNGDMTIGGTVTVPAEKTWNVGDSGSTGAVLTVEDGGELVINGTVNLTTHFGGRATGVVVEKDAVLRVNSTGTLYTDDYWEVMQISGSLIITGTVNFRGDAINVPSGGSIDLSGAGTMFSGYGLSNSGTITVPGFAYYVFSGSKFTNNDGGTYVLRPTDSTVGATISNLSSYMDNSGTIMFDASLLTKPTGTASVTLVTISSTSLTLGADSLTGCSTDYYVKQDGMTGAVTLQLHAAKDSAGVYYDDVEDAFDAIVEDNTLTVTILDGTEASYDETLASKGLGRNGTQIFFLVAEVTFSDDSVVQCYSLENAYNAISLAAPLTYKYIMIKVAGEFAPAQGTRYIVPEGAIPVSSSPEYGTPVANEPDGNGAITYNIKATNNPTTYILKDTDGNKYWAVFANWTYGNSVPATRKPQAGDSIVIANGATVTFVYDEAISTITIGATSPVTFTATSAKTLTVSEDIVLHNASASLVVNSNVTIADIGSKIRTDVADKCVKWVYGESSKTYSVADPVAEFGGTQYGSLANAIEVATDAGLASITVIDSTAEVPDGYYLINDDAGIAKYQAAIVDESAGVHYYATVDGAVTDFLGSYLLTKTYDHFEIYSSTNVVVNVNAASDVLNNNSLKIKCTEAGVSATLSPTTVEYEFVAGDPDESGIITYTRQEKATTYVWSGASGMGSPWMNIGKWRVGTSDGVVATRAPSTYDSVIINDGAIIYVHANDINVASMTINGAVKITGNNGSVISSSTINLATASASLVYVSITVSPVPTTSVSGKAVKSTTIDYDPAYVVVAAGAMIGDVGYETLGDAITAASNGATITLAADCNTANINLGGKSITFNEGSYTFTGSFTGNGTLVLTALLKSAATARWAEGWTGTVWLRNYTDLTGESKQGSKIWGATNFEPNNYGNSNSTVRFTGVKGYLTANDDGSYTIQPALELEDDGDTPGLLLYNGWGYNSSAQCYTIIRELKGSGTLAADTTLSGTSIPGLNVLLQVRKWDNFTGTLNMPNKNIVFGSTLPAQSVVEGGGHIVVQSGAVVTVPTGKTWTAANGFVVSGAIKSEAELTVTSGDASMRLSEATDGGYHVYVLVPSPSEVTTTTFDFNVFTYGDLPVTLGDGDTIIVPSDCGGNQWHPSLSNAAGHPVIVRKEMNWKAGIGTMVIDTGVTVYAYGANGTALNDSGSVISGSGTLALQDSVPVNGVASVLCTISGEGSFSLRNRNATLTVSSPLPAGKVTTSVTGAKVISESVDAGTRYRVVYGTIFSVY